MSEPRHDNSPRVTLGDHEYPVYPQRIGYLRNRLTGAFADLISGEIEFAGADGLLDAVGEQAYDLLRVFIPKLMPRYEFEGYGSQEAFEAHDYDPERDSGPTHPEVIGAFETAIAVNRFDLYSGLGKVVDWEIVRRRLSIAMLDSMPTPPSPEDGPPSLTS